MCTPHKFTHPGRDVERDGSVGGVVVSADMLVRRQVRLHGVVENGRDLEQLLDSVTVGAVQLLRVQLDVRFRRLLKILVSRFEVGSAIL